MILTVIESTTYFLMIKFTCQLVKDIRISVTDTCVFRLVTSTVDILDNKQISEKIFD